ncbi:transposase [Spirosoma pollinicola]|uniref:Tc1-like transposase DDE domain-containing protein n=1 Tax=Spirosoma pollinicola TaxID=2057025 RepID=A0A2K8Z9J8_9BACT|nr:hypothetical protein CWM47_34635 [Spirosoma pollinicola]
MDCASIHRGEAVKTFLKERPGRVHLERLPAYSPELNPTELVWNQLKKSLKESSVCFAGGLNGSGT